MQTRIAAFCSAAALLSAVTTTALAQEGPVSRINETTSPAASTAPATGTPAPGAGAAGDMTYGTSPAAPPAGTGSAAAAAQTAPAATATPYTAQNISDEKLQQFVASAQQVAVLSQQYTQQLQGTQDQAQQQQVIAEANTRMEQAVQANGLTVEEFNGIGEAIEADPELTRRAQQMLQ